MQSVLYKIQSIFAYTQPKLYQEQCNIDISETYSSFVLSMLTPFAICDPSYRFLVIDCDPNRLSVIE